MHGFLVYIFKFVRMFSMCADVPLLPGSGSYRVRIIWRQPLTVTYGFRRYFNIGNFNVADMFFSLLFYLPLFRSRIRDFCSAYDIFYSLYLTTELKIMQYFSPFSIRDSFKVWDVYSSLITRWNKNKCTHFVWTQIALGAVGPLISYMHVNTASWLRTANLQLQVSIFNWLPS